MPNCKHHNCPCTLTLDSNPLRSRCIPVKVASVPCTLTLNKRENCDSEICLEDSSNSQVKKFHLCKISLRISIDSIIFFQSRIFSRLLIFEEFLCLPPARWLILTFFVNARIASPQFSRSKRHCSLDCPQSFPDSFVIFFLRSAELFAKSYCNKIQVFLSRLNCHDVKE